MKTTKFFKQPDDRVCFLMRKHYGDTLAARSAISTGSFTALNATPLISAPGAVMRFTR